jgi:5-(carboxyamino)imidazole ribonucleotide synthase
MMKHRKIACDKFFKGDLMDFATVYNFKISRCFDFEIELVNLEALVKLETKG